MAIPSDVERQALLAAQGAKDAMKVDSLPATDVSHNELFASPEPNPSPDYLDVRREAVMAAMESKHLMTPNAEQGFDMEGRDPKPFQYGAMNPVVSHGPETVPQQEPEYG